ncbi:MAG: HEAT repeat domain-containing protein [Planctomycetota bacterium]|jgi:hypothetical protein
MRVAIVIHILASVAAASDDLSDLVTSLGSTTYAERDVAYAKLKKRTDPKVVPMLEKVIEGYPFANQAYAVNLIAAFRPKISSPALRRLAKSGAAHVRVAAAAQLLQRGEKKMLGVVTATLTKEGVDESERGFMIQRVRYLRQPAVYDSWRSLITSQRSVMNIYGIFDALSVEGYKGATTEARAFLASDKRSGPRAVAATYLVACGDPSAAPVLARIIADGGADVSAFARVTSQLNRARIYPSEVMAAIAARAPKEENSYVVASMLQLLAASDQPEARRWVEPFLEHKEARVAKAALAALAAMRALPERGILERLVAEGDDERALVAANLLRQVDDHSGFQRVLKIAKDNSALRRDAVKALGYFRRAEAVDPLLTFMADKDSTIRSYAATALLQTLRALYPFRRFETPLAGYAYQAPESERAAALAKIRTWWRAHAMSGW